MYTKVLSIDQQILTEMIASEAVLLGVYTHAIHLFVADKIITLGKNIGKGKHHILIDTDINFKELELTTDIFVLCTSNQIIIGNLICLIDNSSVEDFVPFKQTYTVNQAARLMIDQLKIYMANSHAANIYNYDSSNFIENYQFIRIKYFLDNPTYDTAKMILGLGDGLTPLGDDILVGYITGLNVLGNISDWLYDVIDDAKKYTTRFSNQNLNDVYQRHYSSHYIQMIQGILETQNIEMIKPVLLTGHTSGAGIVTGFIHAILQGEK